MRADDSRDGAGWTRLPHRIQSPDAQRHEVATLERVLDADAIAGRIAKREGFGSICGSGGSRDPGRQLAPDRRQGGAVEGARGRRHADPHDQVRIALVADAREWI